MQRKIAVGFTIPLLWMLGFGRPSISHGRAIVIEEFASTTCAGCFGAGGGLDLIEQEYPRSQLFIISYHLHDPFEVPINNTRLLYYGDNGVPATGFDGVSFEYGGQDWTSGQNGINAMHALYVSHIENELARIGDATYFHLSLTGSTGPSNAHMTLTITAPVGYPNALSATFLVTEDAIPIDPADTVSAQTVLNAVVRGHLGTVSFSMPGPGSRIVTVSRPGTIPFRSPAKLHPAVFIQDDVTKEILDGIGEFVVFNSAEHWSQYD